MQHWTLAKNGHEYEHARPGGYTKRFQPHGEDARRSCLLLEEFDWDQAMAVGPQRPSH